MERGARRVVWGVPSHQGKDLRGARPPPQKSLEMACFGAFRAPFISVSSPEKCRISAQSGDLVDVEYVLLRISEFSVKVMSW